MSVLLKILKIMTCIVNGNKFLTVVIWLVEEHEVAMAPAFRPLCFSSHANLLEQKKVFT